MSKALVLLFGAASLGALGYYYIYQHSPIIQEDINARTIKALAYDDTKYVTVVTHGRDIILSGNVDNTAAKQVAEMRTYMVEGVRTVDNQLIVHEAIPEIIPKTVNNTQELMESGNVQELEE